MSLTIKRIYQYLDQQLTAVLPEYTYKSIKQVAYNEVLEPSKVIIAEPPANFPANIRSACKIKMPLTLWVGLPKPIKTDQTGTYEFNEWSGAELRDEVTDAMIVCMAKINSTDSMRILTTDPVIRILDAPEGLGAYNMIWGKATFDVEVHDNIVLT